MSTNDGVSESLVISLSDTLKTLDEVLKYEYIHMLELENCVESSIAMMEVVKQALKIKDRKLFSLHKPLETSLKFILDYLEGAKQARVILYEIAGGEDLIQYIKNDNRLEEKIVVYVRAIPIYLGSIEMVKKSESHIKKMVKQAEVFSKKKEGLIKDNESTRSEQNTDRDSTMGDVGGEAYGEKELKFFVNDLMNYLKVLQMQSEEKGLSKYSNVIDEMKKFEKASRKMKIIGYYGERIDDMKEGPGQYYYLNGDVYDGEWKNDKKHGIGTQTFKEKGDKYEGMWRENKMDGKGIYYYANGSYYDGMWKNNQRDGFGEFHFPNGDKYDGEWKDDQMHGRGIMYYHNGSKFTGEWKNNEINGRGIFLFANGYQIDEDWRDGVKKKEHMRV